MVIDRIVLTHVIYMIIPFRHHRKHLLKIVRRQSNVLISNSYHYQHWLIHFRIKQSMHHYHHQHYPSYRPYLSIYWLWFLYINYERIYSMNNIDEEHKPTTTTSKRKICLSNACWPFQRSSVYNSLSRHRCCSKIKCRRHNNSSSSCKNYFSKVW